MDLDLTNQIPEADRRMGFLVDISNLSLSEGEDTSTSWIHAMSLGSYKHPLYGKIQFTAERMQRFAKNVIDRVRGIDIAIDFSHKNTEEAAGWVKAAEARDNGLWLLVEWTKEAAEAIRSRKFRYFSPEFVDAYTDAATGKKYRDVLLGGGLTNRPFLKDLLPVNLGEVFGETNEEEESSVTLDEFMNKLREKLDLGEDATEDDVLSALPTSEEPPKEEPPAQMSEEAAAQFRALQEKVVLLETANKLTEVNAHLKDWTKGNGDRAVPAALQDDLKGLLLAAPKALSESIVGIVDKILSEGLVDMTVNAPRRSPEGPRDGESATPATDKFHAAVEKIMSENPDMDYVEATAEASRDEQLFEDYREEQFELSEEGN
jgi:hypothetical protein